MTTATPVYAVITPVNTYEGKQFLPTLITSDLSEAKSYARQQRSKLLSKGFQRWAHLVKIQSPKTSEGYSDLARRVLSYAHDLDFASNGNNIYAQSLIAWGNRLKRLSRDLQSA